MKLGVGILVVTLLQICLAARGRLPTNEEASCPRGCSCDRTNVACRNKNFDSNVFSQIQQKAFPNLETIVMTGNNFEDISNNIFETSPMHRSVSLFNLTNSKITRISMDTFENTPNVEYLYLKDNQITYAGKNSFRHLERLRRLDMTNGLGRRTAKSKADMLSLMFDTGDASALPELSEMFLGDNEIEELHKDTFCKVSGLIRLDLSNNKLKSFEVSPGCLKTLKTLILSGNNFTTIPAALWDSLPQLTTLDISGNPLICDCKIQPFVSIAKDENNDFLNQGITYCEGPAAFKGQNLFELRVDLCKTGGWGFGTSFLLIIVAVAGLFTYRHYRRRQAAAALPFQFGYSGLDLEEDVQPEFV